MKIVLLGMLLIFGEIKAKSQDLSGEWKGIQKDFSGNEVNTGKIDLELIKINDSTYNGYTRTYWPKDTTVCKIIGIKKKKNEYFIEEIEFVKSNFTDTCHFQKMNLKLNEKKGALSLKGGWENAYDCRPLLSKGLIKFTKPM